MARITSARTISSQRNFVAPITLLGMHRFIRGDLHHALHAMRDGGADEDASAADVVVDCLAHIRFHQRHMFVRGGMKEDLRLIFLHHRVHARGVTHIADDGLQYRTRVPGNCAAVHWQC